MNVFTQEIGGDVALRAMPLLLLVLCILMIAYRYYSAFLAAKVAALDDSRITPAHTLQDGQNYHPTNKWVLFGHHFAAISGAGPLIGPVLAIQYGYMPGLLWLVIGVCLAGAVQDMLVLMASVRRGGKSLAQIALTELGRPAAVATSVAILAIVVIALAGLGFVVVKALGGEEVKLAKGTEIFVDSSHAVANLSEGDFQLLQFPPGCLIRYPGAKTPTLRPEAFELRAAQSDAPVVAADEEFLRTRFTLRERTVQMIPGSSWGTFTIACTIPIALLVSLWMYKIRPGKVTEASALGAIGVLFATVAGSWIPGSVLEPIFALSKNQTIFALCAYGFIASVLPVWLLLCPRDYISSFLKIGTIALLVLGVIVANPPLRCPPINHVFIEGGPTFAGNIFPFVFICIMCGAISGFHALVASGTTPKMVNKETDIRMIGYGSMLMEGLVGIVALFAAASLPVDLYYDINVDLDKAPKYQAQLDELYKEMHIDRAAAGDKLHALGVDNVAHLNIDDADLAQLEQLVGGESLRGRTGGAVTLAVGMSRILTTAMYRVNLSFEGVVKYWYHFAIMFEALFILTTIDTGTRIARFLLQETLGKVFPRFERPDWIPGSIIATSIVTAGWGGLVATGSISTIWPMFGIANQLLAAMALALVTTVLINSGRGRYAWVTIVPMAFVIVTTMTAGVTMSRTFMSWIIEGEGRVVTGVLSLTLTMFVMISVGTVLLISISRWIAMATGMIKSAT
ncbi:MAG: carbon starvation protein A [Planctomycetota bacterium]